MQKQKKNIGITVSILFAMFFGLAGQLVGADFGFKIASFRNSNFEFGASDVRQRAILTPNATSSAADTASGHPTIGPAHSDTFSVGQPVLLYGPQGFHHIHPRVAFVSSERSMLTIQARLDRVRDLSRDAKAATPAAGPTADPLNRYSEDFTSDKTLMTNSLPTGFIASTYPVPTAGVAPFSIVKTDGVTRLGEPSSGAAEDLVYYQLATPLRSLFESFSFKYAGPTSIVEPFLVSSSSVSAGKTLSGLRFDVTGAAANNNGAGNLYFQYAVGSKEFRFIKTRLRTEPYHYIFGHRYRVDIVADPATSTLSGRVYDTALAPLTFDRTKAISLSGLSVYPGLMNHFGGAVAVDDFTFGPAENLPIRAIGAMRAFDYINSQGYSYSAGTKTPGTDVDSAAILQLFPQLLTRHLRINADGNVSAMQNRLAPYGVNADCLTSLKTTVASLTTFISRLTNGCESIELNNEPNNAFVNPDRPSDWLDLIPSQAAAFRATFPNTIIFGPSVLPDPNNNPTVQASIAAPAARTAAESVPSIASSINFWNAHAYAQLPEDLGWGGFFKACGIVGVDYPLEDCGYYGAVNWNDNLSRVLAPNLGGVTTEGAASFRSYTFCGGIDNQTQQAYIERAFLYNFKVGHFRTYAYKLVDDGGCRDATWGIINKLRNVDGTIQSENPKPSFTSIAYLNHLLFDYSPRASSFTPAPLSFTIAGQTPDVEELLLAQADGSYRLVLWSDDRLWEDNPKSGPKLAIRNPASDAVTVELGTAATYEVYTQAVGTGIWSTHERATGTSIAATVTAYPLVIDIIPKAKSSATPVPLPIGISTPGPEETPEPPKPTPPSAFTPLVVKDDFSNYRPGARVIPTGWLIGNSNSPWTIGGSPKKEFGEFSTLHLNENLAMHRSDEAWYNFFAQRVEEEFTFTAVSSAGYNLPVCGFFPTTSVASSWWRINAATGLAGVYINGYGKAPLFSTTLRGNATSPLIAGDRYAVKFLFVGATPPATGTDLSEKIWNLTAGQTEPPYPTALHVGHSIRGGIAAGIMNCTGNDTTTWSIGDFAAAYNGGTLPEIPF